MKKIIVLIILFVSVTISCNKPDEIGLLKIVNRTNKSIVIAYSKLYPDTAVYKDKIYDVGCQITLPDTTCDAYDKGWRGRFNQNPQQTLIFFIYDSTAVFTNPTKKIIIDLDSMERANWILYVY